jgi:hypothetical protein
MARLSRSDSTFVEKPRMTNEGIINEWSEIKDEETKTVTDNEDEKALSHQCKRCNSYIRHQREYEEHKKICR